MESYVLELSLWFCFINNSSCDVSSFDLCLCSLVPFPFFIYFFFFQFHDVPSWLAFILEQANNFLNADVERNRVGNLAEWWGFVLSNTLLLNPPFSSLGAHHPPISALRLPRLSVKTSRLKNSRFAICSFCLPLSFSALPGDLPTLGVLGAEWGDIASQQALSLTPHCSVALNWVWTGKCLMPPWPELSPDPVLHWAGPLNCDFWRDAHVLLRALSHLLFEIWFYSI